MSKPNNAPLTKERVHEVLWNLAAKRSDRGASDLKPETRLIQDLSLDSLDVAELSMELEEELGINLPNEALENPELTLGDVEKAIVTRLPS